MTNKQQDYAIVAIPNCILTKDLQYLTTRLLKIDPKSENDTVLQK